MIDISLDEGMVRRAEILTCLVLVTAALPLCRFTREGKGDGKPAGKNKAAAGKDFPVSSVTPGEEEPGSEPLSAALASVGGRLVVIPEDVPAARTGDRVRVQMLDWPEVD